MKDGWIRVLVSSWDDESESYYIAAKSNGEEVFRAHGEFYLDVPISVEAQEEAMSGASTSFMTDDGKVKVEGPQAPAARKYYSDALEPCRGEARDLAKDGTVLSGEAFQEMLDAATPYTGRGGKRTPSVSRDDIDGMTTDELAAYLASRGVAVK